MDNRSGMSRRDFLAASSLGAIGLTSCAAGVGGGSRSGPEAELLYVGTYTSATRDDGIHLVRMDARTGALSLVASVKAGPNPSFLAIHPNGRVVYAVNEVTELAGKATGAVRAFAITPD